MRKPLRAAWIRACFRLSVLLWAAVAVGCTAAPPDQGKPKIIARSVAERDLPDLTDDRAGADLAVALQRSLDYLAKLPKDREFPLGEGKVSAQRLRRSLEAFAELLAAGRLDRDEVARRFEFFQLGSAAAERGPGSVLVTGYYEPILKAATVPDERFRYPIYRLPPDLVQVDLSRFDPQRFGGEQVVGRVEQGWLKPYYSRAEIDGRGVLQGRGWELAYLEDPLDAFFLHVQGSGMLESIDGQRWRIGYAATNGRRYRSIGKVLIERGAVPAEQMSLQAIRSHLRAHPEQRDELLYHNESYVFFRRVEDGPLGSLNLVLTPGRSVATDAGIYPRAALGFLVTTQPQVHAEGEVERWLPSARWVVHQDTGGAIKGAGRVDLFCGTGADAEAVAGRLKQPGTLYLVLVREDTPGP